MTISSKKTSILAECTPENTFKGSTVLCVDYNPSKLIYNNLYEVVDTFINQSGNLLLRVEHSERGVLANWFKASRFMVYVEKEEPSATTNTASSSSSENEQGTFEDYLNNLVDALVDSIEASKEVDEVLYVVHKDNTLCGPYSSIEEVKESHNPDDVALVLTPAYRKVSSVDLVPVTN